MTNVEDYAKKFDFGGAMSALLISAFGFVAALFWRDAITALLEEMFPSGSGLTYSFVVAILVSFIAIIVIFIVAKINKKSNEFKERVVKRRAAKKERRKAKKVSAPKKTKK